MPRDGTFTKPDAETAALLRKAKALIDTPEKWCQGFLARNILGFDVLPGNPDAVAFCARGALLFEAAGRPVGKCDKFLAQAARKIKVCASGSYPHVDLNNTTDHPTVMRMFDLAIEMAREEG